MLKNCPKMTLSLCKGKYQCFIDSEVFYPLKEDYENQKAVNAIATKKKFQNSGFNDNQFYFIQDEEFDNIAKRQFNFEKEELEGLKKRTFKILDKCNYEITPTKEIDTLPVFVPDNIEKVKMREFLTKYNTFLDQIIEFSKENYKENAIVSIEDEKDKFLIYKCSEELIKRNLHTDIRYVERLKLELERIIRKQYSNYFLATWDFVSWAKENGIAVGYGRGSAGASIIAFLLSVTDIDPIKYDLLFDRFISDIRKDAPDIDLDFMDRRRKEIFEYLIKKYGDKRCARIITYSRFHPKGVLRDVGRIFGISSIEINKMCGLIIERSGGDARASFALQDTFEEFEDAKQFKEKYPQASKIAIALESHVRHKGVHAAAMVVASEEICNYSPVTQVGGLVCTEWEKGLCEDMKLIKFDILGLKTLSIINDAVKFAKCTLPTDFNDSNIFQKIFCENNAFGIFQFDIGMQKLAQNIQPKNFAELSDCSALYRPGTLHSGQTQIYVDRCQGKQKVEPLHKGLENITKSTKHIILYQEQVMQVMNNVGHLGWATAEMARKVITKSKGTDFFKKMKQDFIKGASKYSNIPEEEGSKIFDIVSQFGSYGFNKAHAYEYTMLSYICGWLKYYHPTEFFAALLKNESDDEQFYKILQDAKLNGVSVKGIDINYSDTEYCMHEKEILSGLSSINGLGPKMCEKILNNRPYSNFEDFKKRCKVNKNVMAGLIVAGAFDKISNLNKKREIMKLDKETAKQIIEGMEDYDDNELTELILDKTSLFVDKDVDMIFDFGNYDFVNICDVEKVEDLSKTVMLRGIVTNVVNNDKQLKVGGGNKNPFNFESHLYYLNVNDGTGNLAIGILPHTYEKYAAEIANCKKKPVIIMGKIVRDRRKMFAEVIQFVGVNNDIDLIKRGDGYKYVTAAFPQVSKKGNKFYQITINDSVKGLLFNVDRKIFVMDKVKSYHITKKPFINVEFF